MAALELPASLNEVELRLRHSSFLLSLQYWVLLFPSTGFYFLKMILYWIIVTLQCCWFLLYSKMSQPYLCMYPLHFGPCPLRWPQCLKQSFPCWAVCSHELFTLSIVSIAYESVPVSPTPLSPWYPSICSLYLYSRFCFAHEIIYAIFLDCIYMH